MSAHKNDDAVNSLLNDPVLQLNDHRTNAFVAEVQQCKAAQPRVGDTWYVVPARWYNTFCAEPDHASAIVTTPLCQQGTQRLKIGARESIDYELVPRAAWEKLIAQYPLQGPPIACSVIPGVHASHAPRVELHPPTINLLKIGTPTQTSSGTPSITMSAASTFARLKAQCRAMLAIQVEDDAMRFIRVPVSLQQRADLQGGIVTESDVRTVVPPPELVDGTGNATLQALQLDTPQLALALDIKVNGHWQVNLEDKTTVLASPKQKKASHRGLRGLMNIGNTCFMNSALQCLSNTPELAQYFLKEAHCDEINTENPLGMGGALAGTFARLLHQLWGSSDGSIVPREFKSTLARFAPQFTGYAQHDSQELLAFLLDGLHEDLNRIIKKPYIEAPDWPGGSDKDMLRFAQQQWDIYKARNDSVIVDLFQGQYRSTLVCPVCENVSVKFDPFMYLTLPIPNTRKWRGRVYVMPLATTQPIIQVDVQLLDTATVANLCTKVAELLHLDASNLIVGEVWSHHVYRWLADYEPVRDIASGDFVYLWEQPAPFRMPQPLQTGGRFAFFKSAARSIEEIEKQSPPPTVTETVTLPVYSCVGKDSPSTHRVGSFRRMLGEPFGLPFFVTIANPAQATLDTVYDAVLQQYARFSKQPTDDLGVFRERMQASLSDTSSEDQSSSTSKRACEMYFAMPPTDEAMHRGDDIAESSTENLSLRMDRLNTSDSWPVLFNGGALVCIWDGDVSQALFDAVPSNYTWGPVREEQDPDFAKTSAQYADGVRRAPKLQLSDCLDEFTRAEQLGEDDLWYCPRCKEFRQAMKKFDLWKVPDILVVHLKRFSAGRISRNRLDNFIDFPVYGLDLSDRVVGTLLMNELQLDAPPSMTVGDKFQVAHDPHDDAIVADQPIYDLYAVDNHFGGLAGGHYTAFAKNPVDDQWYNYDDSSVRPVSDPESVKSSAAYLLFYRRRTSRPIGGKSQEILRERGQSFLARTSSASSTAPDYLRDVPLPSSDDTSSSSEEEHTPSHIDSSDDPSDI
ncbi:ubiquitinyl hydrolase 1 [Malassezia psittaci]|uniref:ubiquitinyl hydrolase 1 n=1 Tax=Malassezia psittaci TaxID=1821823 RepID=A0AAF0JEJ7_9BASI|nr:ubiquitinyl hydrolase 1 [Malassezia psittaci]